MTKTHKVLLGANEYNEVVFGEFGVKQYEDGHKFSASFFTVEPTSICDADLQDYAERYYEDYVDDMMHDGKWLWMQCDEYDCKPSDLAYEMASGIDDIRDILDCSLYPNIITVNGSDWVFESMSCGQHDTRNSMTEYVDKDSYNKLHELWDNYHLENIDDDIIKEVDELAKKMYHDDAFIESWIADYIERVII